MEPELRDYLRVLRKHGTLVLIAFAACVIVAVALTYAATPVYEAEAKLFVGQRQISTAQVAQGQTVTDLSAKLLKSYAAILRSNPISALAVKKASLAQAPRELAEDLVAQPVLDTQIIELRYRAADPALARKTVNAVAYAFVAEVQKLERQIVEDGSDEAAVKVSVFDPALLPTGPVEPQPVRNYALGGMTGLLLGIGLAFLVEQFDVRIKDKEAIEQSLGLPVLASVPRIQTRRDELYLEGDNQSRFAETFRKLRTAIQLYGGGEPVRTILVTSPKAREGKSTTALNLAAIYAYSGSQTVLVEADLRRPQLHEQFAPVELNGLTVALLGRAIVDDVLVRTSIEHLTCIPAGAIPPNPVELLASGQMQVVLEELKLRYDTIIIDAPPLLPIADASTIAPRVDGVLLVARSKETRRDHLKESAELVQKVGGKVLGVVLNAVLDGSGSDYSYYYYSPKSGATRENGGSPGVSRRLASKLLGRSAGRIP